MKKIVTYMMALGMIFTAVPANAVYVADALAVQKYKLALVESL